MTSPCMVCEERFIGCHAECEVFHAWQKEQREKRSQKYQVKNRVALLDDFKADAMKKKRRKRR